MSLFSRSFVSRARRAAFPFFFILVSGSLAACVGTSQGRRGGPMGAYSGPAVTFEGTEGAQIVGRAEFDKDGGAKVAWAGTWASVHFNGTAVSLDITEGGNNEYLVLIDGKPKREKVIPTPGRSTVELIKGLPRGEHTVAIYKLNEPLVGSATWHAFILDEYGTALAPAPLSGPRIEILGDSISTGYGNEGSDESCGFSPETQNHYLTYGARAARELGATLTTVAWSGKGVFTNRGSKVDTATLPALWRKTLPREGVDFAFSQPQPNVVLINLGSNDFAPEVADTSPFAQKYEEFLKDVRAQYPDAHVFLLVGPLLTDSYPEGKAALTTVRTTLSGLVEKGRAAGDDKLHYLEFAQVTPSEGLGCDFHPSVTTHSRMAATLISALKERAAL